MKKILFTLFLFPLFVLGQPNLSYSDGDFKVSSGKLIITDSLDINDGAGWIADLGTYIGIEADASHNIRFNQSAVYSATEHFGFGWGNTYASNLTFKMNTDTCPSVNMVGILALRGVDAAHTGGFGLNKSNFFITSAGLPTIIKAKGNIELNPNYNTTGKRVDVNGEIRITAGNYNFTVLGTGETNLHSNAIRVKGATKRVGINESSPSHTLDVNGDMQVVSELQCDSTITIGDFIKLTPQASAPSTPSEGWIYMNSTDHHLYVYNGSGWVQIDN